MKIRITEQQYSRLFEQVEKGLSTKEVALFKLLNRMQPKLRNKEQITNMIGQGLQTLGLIPSGMSAANVKRAAHNYLEKYAKVYRADGDYDRVTSAELNASDRGKRSKKNDLQYYTTHLIPFRYGPGDKLKAVMERHAFGKNMYVVLSYEWYPIFIHYNRQWYEVSNRYSSSTARQISNCRPTYNTIVLSPEEMKRLREGEGDVDIVAEKLDTVLKNCRTLVGKVFKERGKNGSPTIYKIVDVVQDENKVRFDVEILKTDPAFRNYGTASHMMDYLLLPKIQQAVGSHCHVGDVVKINVIENNEEKEL